jgi:hypothetical protein
MLTVTFLGHQGWMFGAGGTHIMVDPLLGDSFGVMPEGGLRVFPPRKVNVAAAPPVSAVLFTHEHDDHFQIASLAQLDRRILILLSDRSSSAAKRIAERLGFRTVLVSAEDALRFGDLELRTFAVDFLPDRGADEWDVLPFSVRDDVSGASFLSTVDLPAEYCSSKDLRKNEAPTIIGVANNFTSNHCLTNWMVAPPGGLQVLPELSHRIIEASKEPRTCAALLSGGGWSFDGPLAWLNHCCFPSDNTCIASALVLGGRQERPSVRAPLPGETVLAEGDQLVGFEQRYPDFIHPLPRSEWPDRRYARDSQRATEVAPLLYSPLGSDGLGHLRDRLKLLARWLVGRRFFLALNSLTKKELGNLKRAFVLFVQTDLEGGGYLFEYSTGEPDFVPAQAPIETYAAGATCWASDLLGVLSGGLTGSMFAMGRIVEWVRCQTPRPNFLSLAAHLWSYDSAV